MSKKNVDPPRCGQTYRFTVSVWLLDGCLIKRGDLLHLIEPTGLKPYGHFDKKSGHNWLCKGPNGVTVWSTVPEAIQWGLLLLEEDNGN